VSDDKARGADALRDQAKTAIGFAQAMRNLAPVVVRDFQAVVGVKLRAGLLMQEWSKAKEAAAKSEIEGDEKKELAAVAVMLQQWAAEAGRRIAAHAQELERDGYRLEGRAEAAEEQLAAEEVEPEAEA
jgi:hypothetical protein